MSRPVGVEDNPREWKGEKREDQRFSIVVYSTFEVNENMVRDPNGKTWRHYFARNVKRSDVPATLEAARKHYREKGYDAERVQYADGLGLYGYVLMNHSLPGASGLEIYASLEGEPRVTPYEECIW